MKYFYKENLYKSIKYDFWEEKPKSVEKFLEIFEDIKYNEFEAKLMLNGSPKREVVFISNFFENKRKITYIFSTKSDIIIETFEIIGRKKYERIFSKFEFQRQIFDNLLFEKMFNDFVDVKLDLEKD